MSTLKKPIIGIVGRVDYASDNDCVICIWEEIRNCIVLKGAIPLLILPTQIKSYKNQAPSNLPSLTTREKQDIIRIIDLCDAILFAGGYQWYSYDAFIYHYACMHDIPILGICLGMQMMATLDLNTKEVPKDDTMLNQTHLNHHQREKRYVHSVEIQEDSLLHEIVGMKKLQVNSKHRYHVEKVKGLMISAYSEDGLIEAVEDKSKRFLLGIQWHPETMISYDVCANRIIEAFIKAASAYAQEKGKNSCP